jgi:hypothetical protein
MMGATLCVSFAVLEVRPDGTAVIQWGWGVAPQWGIRQPGFVNRPVEIADDTLTFSFNAGRSRVTLVYSGTALNAQYTEPGSTQRGTLRKVP